MGELKGKFRKRRGEEGRKHTHTYIHVYDYMKINKEEFAKY